MTQREQTLQKHLEDINLHESVRDAIHDAMEEHAIEFKYWCDENEHQVRLNNIYENGKNTTTEQLYNKFNLNK